MGRIIQTSELPDLIPEERKPLRITQWKFLIPHEILTRLEVCTGYSVFTIENMTLEDFNKINAANEDARYAFSYSRSALICTRCGGTGIVDWIDKATTGSERVTIFKLNDVLKYVRKKNGPIHVLKSLTDDSLIYTSSPHKKIGEEYCDECNGCGIKLQSFNLRDVMYFDKC